MDLIQNLYADSDSDQETPPSQQQQQQQPIPTTSSVINVNLTPNFIAPTPSTATLNDQPYSVAPNPSLPRSSSSSIFNDNSTKRFEPLSYSGSISSHYHSDRNAILKQKQRQRAHNIKQMKEKMNSSGGGNDGDDEHVMVNGKIPGFASFVYDDDGDENDDKNDRSEERVSPNKKRHLPEEQAEEEEALQQQQQQRQQNEPDEEKADKEDEEEKTEKEEEEQVLHHVNKQAKLDQDRGESNVIRGDDGETVIEGDAGGYSVFHLKQERDYQGRTFISHPTHLKPKEYRDIRSYVPKKCVHTYAGHQNGISSIQFFPVYGHLLLSASMDGTVKIWGTEQGNRTCIRTYYGHEKAVKGLSFNYDGTRFATSSYDKTVKLWDTETGKVIGTYSNGSIPYCVQINPSESMSHQMLAGCHDKKILQWDVREKKIVQTYDRHLGSINTITFLDGGKQFLSTSEDKSLRLWDYGIPVEIKYIADPYMHATSFVGMHPSQKWLLGQSLDDHIYVYEQGKHGFRQFKKKLFKGHKIAGYACQCGFSNDGRFVISGDAQGNVWFWDWKTGKHITTKKCHDAVTMCVAWHPIEPSKMATASWDNTIKYWD